MEQAPTITVIIPLYNAEKYITEAIASIRRQDYTPLEIIVIDDGSTDASLKIIKTLGDDIQILTQPNAGPAAARNKGLSLGKGELIAFLDADDIWPDDKLSRQYELLSAHPEVEVVVGRSKFFGDFSARDRKIPLDENQTAVGFNLLSGLFRRSAFEQVGRFDETLRYSEDYDWLLRAREVDLPIHILQAIVLLRRIHQESMTHAADTMHYQLPQMLKKSIDRRRRAGKPGSLPELSNTRDQDESN